jgi:hypothetical protein
MPDSFRDLCAQLIRAWDRAPTPSDFMDRSGYGVIDHIREALNEAAITSRPTPEELRALAHDYVLGGESPEDFSFDAAGYAKAICDRCWGPDSC